MRKVLHFWFIIQFIVTGQVVCAQASQTFSKPFNLQSVSKLVLDLGTDVVVQTWNEPHVKVTSTVQLLNQSSTILNGLMQAGRYNFVAEVSNGEMHISCPGLDRPVRINGTELKERISYIVFVPKGLIVQNSDMASAKLK